MADIAAASFAPAPKSLIQPQITIQINVNPNRLPNTDFEVYLKVEGKAELTGTSCFASISTMPACSHPSQENVGPLLMIESPRGHAGPAVSGPGVRLYPSDFPARQHRANVFRGHPNMPVCRFLRRRQRRPACVPTMMEPILARKNHSGLDPMPGPWGGRVSPCAQQPDFLSAGGASTKTGRKPRDPAAYWHFNKSDLVEPSE
jgi:hypothetical protein